MIPIRVPPLDHPSTARRGDRRGGRFRQAREDGPSRGGSFDGGHEGTRGGADRRVVRP